MSTYRTSGGHLFGTLPDPEIVTGRSSRTGRAVRTVPPPVTVPVSGPVPVSRPRTKGASGIALETHYRPRELAALWGFSDRTVINLFASEPGVIRLNPGTGKLRRYVTLSIPESVALRVHERLSRESFGQLSLQSAS